MDVLSKSKALLVLNFFWLKASLISHLRISVFCMEISDLELIFGPLNLGKGSMLGNYDEIQNSEQ